MWWKKNILSRKIYGKKDYGTVCCTFSILTPSPHHSWLSLSSLSHSILSHHLHSLLSVLSLISLSLLTLSHYFLACFFFSFSLLIVSHFLLLFDLYLLCIKLNIIYDCLVIHTKPNIVFYCIICMLWQNRSISIRIYVASGQAVSRVLKQRNLILYAICW